MRRAGLLVAVSALVLVLAVWAFVHGKPSHRGPPAVTGRTLPATTTTGAMPTTTTVTLGGGYGPQPGVTAPKGARMVAPGGSIGSAITAAGSGGTVFLQAGLHRLTTPVTPLPDQTILGAYGAVVDGSVVVSGPWTRDGAVWWAAAQLPASPNNTGVCEGGGTLCQPTEDVYYDGVKLIRVGSQDAVDPGTFWGDYAGNRIYIGDDPGGHLVEQAKTAAFVGNEQGFNGGVTVRNLVLRKFASPYQRGAIVVNHEGGSATNFWTIEHCEIYYSHAIGVVSFSHHTKVRHNTLRDNGDMGLGSYNTDFLVVEANRVVGNNNAGYDSGWEAGGMKLTKVDDAVIRANEVSGNLASGIWIDIDARRITIEGNAIHDNTHHGIHYEISYDGTIRGNRIVDNAGKGLQWNASARGQVTDNELDGNGWGLWFIADPDRLNTDPPTYPGDPRDLYDVVVADNRVRHVSGTNYAAGIVLQSGAPSSHLSEVGFNRNAYTLASTSAPRFYHNRANTFAQWQANGEDTDGSVGT